MVWDVTVVDTVAPSYVGSTAQTMGAASRIAEHRKLAKYKDLQDQYEVIPIAFETFGSLADDTETTLTEIADLIKQERGGRQGHFFLERLSLALQRGNANCIFQCMQSDEQLNQLLVD